MTPLAYLHRTLEQELLALSRGATYECLVCGEFVTYRGLDVICIHCGLELPDLLGMEVRELRFESQAG
jgi:hypothetical protein